MSTTQRPARASGGTVFRDVPDWGNARLLLQDEDIEVTRAAASPIELRSGEPVTVHVYFENSDGDEVAYYTPAVKSLFVFDVPRKVHASMRAQKTLWKPAMGCAT